MNCDYLMKSSSTKKTGFQSGDNSLITLHSPDYMNNQLFQSYKNSNKLEILIEGGAI